MLIHGWSIALSVCFAGILFLGVYAVTCGIRVLRFWNYGADTPLQIRLESETWLSSALMQYALVFQLLSLLLLVLAADSFSSILVGAMCATGAFLANSYGLPSLVTKIVLVFFCGYWLLLHRLDLQSETYPLVRVKNIYLLVLVPLLLLDGGIQSAYLYLLEPDVITSCCGVVFRSADSDGFNLFDPFATPVLLGIFYGVAAVLLLIGIFLHIQMKKSGSWHGGYALYLYSSLWTAFFVLALWAITVVFSSYIYAMPSHRCPFDILQPEYGYVGYPIYFVLFLASFFGGGCGVAQLVHEYSGLAGPVLRFQRFALKVSLFLLLLFLVFTAYAPLTYLLGGGES